MAVSKVDHGSIGSYFRGVDGALTANKGASTFGKELEKNTSLNVSSSKMWEYLGKVLETNDYKGVGDFQKKAMIQEALQERTEMGTFLTQTLRQMHEAAMRVVSNIRGA